MKTTNLTVGQGELAAMKEQLRAEKQRRIDDLVAERTRAVNQLSHYSQIVEMWRGEHARIQRQIAVLEADDQPVVGAFLKPEGKPTAKASATQAVYDAMAAEPSRRWTATELEAIAGGRKIRQLVADWNTMNPAKQIRTEGGNKNRRYFVG